MTRQERRIIEREFYNYKANREKAENFVEKWALSRLAVDYSAVLVSGSLGNHAETRMVRAISEEEKAYRWCEVFEKTLERFRWEQKDKLMVMKYIQGKHRREIVNSLALPQSTYYFWSEQIVETGYMWAKELEVL